jgi:hypothetical protein
MKNNSKNLKKQITLKIEQISLEFFVPQNYELEQINTLFSISIPGYPAHFTLEGLGDQKTNFPIHVNKAITIFINNTSSVIECFPENLISSLKTENKSSKIIKNFHETNCLSAKTNFINCSNPYNLFSFDCYMEKNFEKIKNKNLHFKTNDPFSLKVYFQQTLEFLFKLFFNGLFNFSRKCLDNSAKVLCILIFFEIFNNRKSNSAIEIFLKFGFKVYALNKFKALVDFKRVFPDIRKKNYDSFEKRNKIEIEISSIRTLMSGFIRSGNMLAI